MPSMPNGFPPGGSSREPVFNVPLVVTILIVLMLGMQLLMVFGPEEWATSLLLDWSFIPARLAAALGLDPMQALSLIHI